MYQTHERAWSRVATIPITDSTLYFKITRPELIFEVRLMEALWEWGMPVPAVLATAPDEGWLLMADSGQSLRSLLQADRDIRRWYDAVTQYARMQIAMIDRTDDLLAIGIFDRCLVRPVLHITFSR